VIPLGLRLTFSGGREAAARLILMVVAAALGVGMLLTTLAAIHAVHAQNARYAWLETSAQAQPGRPSDAPQSVDPAWWLLSADEFQGQLLGRVDVAATGAHAPVPPGISRLPGPGQYYASPALAQLLRTTPRAELGQRFPGRLIGIIGPAGLPARDLLLAVVGHRPAELAGMPGAERVTSISTTPPDACSGRCYYIGIDARGIDLVLSVVTAALLFPILIFIGTATRLSAARREQRFAAMRLVGATPRQITTIATVESCVAALVGTALGFVLFCAMRPAIAAVPFTGNPFYVQDLALTAGQIAVVALGVPAGAVVAARLALRRVTVSPLGVMKRVSPRPLQAWRLVPLAAGIAELSWFVYAGRAATTLGQIAAYLSGILVMMVGIVLAGPWLTVLGSRVMTRWSRRPAGLIAGRRLTDNPRAGFRSISGLVLALFVSTVAIGVMTTITAYENGDVHGGASTRGTLLDTFDDFDTAGPPSMSIPSVPAALLAEVRSIDGVRATALIHAGPAVDPLGPPSGIVSCRELARIPAFGHCPAGATAVTLPADAARGDRPDPGAVWPSAAVSADALDRLPVQTLVVDAQGSRSAVERVRTVLENAYPYRYFPVTLDEIRSQRPATRRLQGYQQLADVVIVAGLAIAGCSLAVSVVAGINERRRPFSLLRLSGTPIGTLRRVVLLETAAPLLGIATVSIAAGFLAAGLFVRSQLRETLQAPGTGYYLTVAGGLIACLTIIASTLPLLRRLTGPEAARND
jgi:hypothetical protein